LFSASLRELKNYLFYFVILHSTVELNIIAETQQLELNEDHLEMDPFKTQLNMPPLSRNPGSSGIFQAKELNLDATTDTLSPSFYVYCNNQKKHFSIPQDKDHFLIGKGADCDITIEEHAACEEQIAVVKLGDFCYFIDRGNQDCVYFNGVKKRQAVIPVVSRMIIKIGHTIIIYIGVDSNDHIGEQNSRVLKNSLDVGKNTDSTPQGELLLKSKAGESFSDTIPILAGSHKACDYKINSLGVEPFHFYIYFTPSGIFIEDLTYGHPGIKVNGMPCIGTHPVSEDVTITIGAFPMYLYTYGSIQKRCNHLFYNFTEFPGLALTSLTEPESDKINLPVTNKKIPLGRDESCEVILDDPSISRIHAYLQIKDKYLYLEDNDSSNKCFVNLEPVEKAKVLPGDIVEFGNVHFLLNYAR
jgi:hypothetical protein